MTNSNKIITYITLELKHFCHLQNLVKKDILKEKETYLKMVGDYVCNVDWFLIKSTSWYGNSKSDQILGVFTKPLKCWLTSNFIFEKLLKDLRGSGAWPISALMVYAPRTDWSARSGSGQPAGLGRLSGNSWCNQLFSTYFSGPFRPRQNITETCFGRYLHKLGLQGNIKSIVKCHVPDRRTRPNTKEICFY